jgi:hypothetical protein
MLKLLALALPFIVVVVMLVNGIHGGQVVAGVLVLSLAIAGVALGAVFGAGSGAGGSRD